MVKIICVLDNLLIKCLSESSKPLYFSTHIKIQYSQHILYRKETLKIKLALTNIPLEKINGQEKQHNRQKQKTNALSEINTSLKKSLILRFIITLIKNSTFEKII